MAYAFLYYNKFKKIAIVIFVIWSHMKKNLDCTRCMIDVDTEDYGPAQQFQKPNYVTTMSMSQLHQLCHKSLKSERSAKSG